MAQDNPSLSHGPVIIIRVECHMRQAMRVCPMALDYELSS